MVLLDCHVGDQFKGGRFQPFEKAHASKLFRPVVRHRRHYSRPLRRNQLSTPERDDERWSRRHNRLALGIQADVVGLPQGALTSLVSEPVAGILEQCDTLRPAINANRDDDGHPHEVDLLNVGFCGEATIPGKRRGRGGSTEIDLWSRWRWGSALTAHDAA